ncbi:uncharacterized protein LOC131876140 [Cryptomeria japonica]|uniref:uncharacterized protein LOC131876140 n=1 Tax=Cryptomeria japonica TaxID=3369 RepID=UPI0027DA50E4|nr:uncharacterized protein LOC131876140 [Cryptomeria japonica]
MIARVAENWFLPDIKVGNALAEPSGTCKRMPSADVKLQSATFASSLPACAEIGALEQGNTALHIAAREGHPELVEWFLQNVKGLSGVRNADLNKPLHEAAKRGNQKIIRTLLRYNNCAAAKRNQFGESALLIASEHGHVDAVRVLVEATPS